MGQVALSPETWQLIAGIAVGLLVILLAAWLVMGRSRDRGRDVSSAEVEQERMERAALQGEVESLREQHGLLAERAARYERTFDAMQERLDRLAEEREARRQRLEAIERGQKELQEQIYEIREEQKVLMQRDDRHERKVNDLLQQRSAEGPAPSVP